MKRLECEFEPEVLAAVLQGRWPERAGETLTVHVSHCDICSDVVAIAGEIDASREDLRAAAVLPDPGILWWRSQLRARREAAVTAGRPITGTQVIAGACALGVLAAYYRSALTWLLAVAAKWFSAVTAPDHLVLALAAGVVLLVLPAAALLAVGRD